MAARPKAGFPRTQRPGAVPPPPEGWTPRARKAEEVVALVERLPLEPGVYIMRDRKGRVAYVGKARSLRARVKQYFSGHDTRYFVPHLGDILGDIETIVTAHEKEALLLENNLIKQHRPRFNFKLRDDKQYLVLRLDPDAEWPRLELVRNIGDDGAKYFGPYHSATRARSTLRVVNRHFQLRTCTDYVLRSRKRPCLQYQIGRCPAPCVYEVDARAYGEQVQDVARFLGGRRAELLGSLEERMKTAAANLEFEVAARLRDQLRAVESSLQSQRVVGTTETNQDVIGLYREGGQVELVLMQVRAGVVLGTQGFSQKGMELPDREVLHGFLSAYYEAAPMIPDEVILPLDLAEDDAEPLAEWLRDKRGRKVTVIHPQRGDRRKLVSLANRNAASNFVTRRDQREDTEVGLARLRDRLGLSRIPERIECFDISHIQGSDPVASMVVFVDGMADKKLYRSFKIKGQEGTAQTSRQNDDFASMYEVLSRRIRRGLDGEDESWALPDLLVIDGGKGQLSRVVAAMQDLGVEVGEGGIDVVSLAKERHDMVAPSRAGLKQLQEFKAAREGHSSPRPGGTLEDYEVARARAGAAQDAELVERVRPERVFKPGAKDPIVLAGGSSELFLMTRIRDEAHRFAITHHRKRRGKRQLKSKLDSIPGVGPALKERLIKHFGSVKAIKAADEKALIEVKGVGKALAGKIREHLGG